jgi:hypothetical protein
MVELYARPVSEASDHDLSMLVRALVMESNRFLDIFSAKSGKPLRNGKQFIEDRGVLVSEDLFTPNVGERALSVLDDMTRDQASPKVGEIRLYSTALARAVARFRVRAPADRCARLQPGIDDIGITRTERIVKSDRAG